MKSVCFLVAASLLFVMESRANPAITVDVSQASKSVSPRLYGMMTEEINHSYDGGLYAELIQNRAFQDNAAEPSHWTAIYDKEATAEIALARNEGINDQLTNSLKLTTAKVPKGATAGVANDGYWGIPVYSKTPYRAVIYAKPDAGFTGSLTLAIASDDGKTVYASKKISKLKPGWNRYEAVLKTGKTAPTTKTRFQITVNKPGAVSLGFVSLFPPTWNNRPNGLRKDLMQMMADMKPKFLRFPGGNYMEGDYANTRFEWKKTIGPVEQRPGHLGPWSYRSSDGLGLLEFLEWCEDLKAEGVLGIYTGYSLKGDYIKAGPDLQPYVDEALDEIEYCIGSTNTTWGARRAKDGHPAPFNINYVEIGNEDWFDKSKSYDGRFAQFFDAIKKKYPQLKLISTIAADQPEAFASMGVTSRKPDMLDEHYYLCTEDFLKKSPTFANDYDRSGPEIFVGEWAAHEDCAIKPWSDGAKNQPPTPSMKAAIGDAAFLTAIERNSDIIKMHCYAPMFVNVNPGARQWRPDLIGYNALSAYGSPSYYAIQMFSGNLGDKIAPVTLSATEAQASATLDSRTGDIFIKLVNPKTVAETLVIGIRGVAMISPNGSAVTMAAGLDDTNTIDQPAKVKPVVSALTGLKTDFSYTMPRSSIVVLRLNKQSPSEK